MDAHTDAWLVSNWIKNGAYPRDLIPSSEIEKPKILLRATDKSGASIGRSRYVFSAWRKNGVIKAISFSKDDTFFLDTSRFIFAQGGPEYIPTEIPWILKSAEHLAYLRSREFYLNGIKYDRKVRAMLLDYFPMYAPLKYVFPYDTVESRVTLFNYVTDLKTRPKEFGRNG